MHRHNDLDFIKAVGIFLVVLVHTVMPLFMQGGSHWVAVDIWGSLARSGVPLFFMVSGALLFPREHSVSGIFRRVWKLLVPLVFWSVVYLIWRTSQGDGVRGWVKTIIREPVAGHLWFLYTMIGAYLVLPILSQFFRTASNRVIVYILCVWVLGATFIPTTSHSMNVNYFGIEMNYIALFPGYMLLGAWLNGYYNEGKRNIIGYGWLALVVGWVLTAVLAWQHTERSKAPNEFFFSYFTTNVVILSIGVFVVLKSVASLPFFQREVSKRVVFEVSRTSFGIYLSHVLVLFIFGRIGFGLTPDAAPWLVPYVLLVMLVSFAIVKAIQSVPYLRAVSPGDVPSEHRPKRAFNGKHQTL